MSKENEGVEPQCAEQTPITKSVKNVPKIKAETFIKVKTLTEHPTDIWNYESYPEPGLYLLDDGVALQLVSVPSVKKTSNMMMPCGMPLPIDMTIEMADSNYKTNTNKRIDQLDDMIETLQDVIEKFKKPMEVATLKQVKGDSISAKEVSDIILKTMDKAKELISLKR